MRKSKILASLLCSGMISIGSQACFGANIQDNATTEAHQHALTVARQHASTETLTSTGYQSLAELSQSLRARELEGGPIATEVLNILKPALILSLNEMRADAYGHATSALAVASLFESQGGSVHQQIIAAARLSIAPIAGQIARENSPSGILKSTANGNLTKLTQALKELEGEGGPIATSVFQTLQPSLSNTLNGCIGSRDDHGLQSVLKIFSLFITQEQYQALIERVQESVSRN